MLPGHRFAPAARQAHMLRPFQVERECIDARQPRTSTLDFTSKIQDDSECCRERHFQLVSLEEGDGERAEDSGGAKRRSEGGAGGLRLRRRRGGGGGGAGARGGGVGCGGGLV